MNVSKCVVFDREMLWVYYRAIEFHIWFETCSLTEALENGFKVMIVRLLVCSGI